MEDDAQALEEVVVVAFGTVKKEAFVGSATQIKAEDIAGRSLTNITQALDGASAGVQISSGSGQPGSGASVRVRGIGSVTSSNEPLYVVDGVIFTGNLSTINANDIASFTILKDAASTSLYGSGASNGVIIITTKKGSIGKSRITLDVSQGISQRSIPEYERINAQQYYPVMWQALRNSLSISGNTPEATANQTATNTIFNQLGNNPFNVPNNQIVGTDGLLNPNAKLLYTDLDWQDELVQTGYKSNIDFSYRGATETTDYFVSLGYLEDEGYIINSDFERVTARININSQLKDWFKTGLNLSGSTSVSNQAVDGAASSNSFVNPFRTTRVMGPIYPVFQHDPVSGAFILDSNGKRIFDAGDRPGQTRAAGGSPGRHPIQENLLNVDKDDNFSVNARTYAEVKFLKDFTFTTNVSFDRQHFNNEGFQNPIIGDAAPSGRASRDAITTTSITFNQLLNYSKVIGKHNFSALAGHESFELERNFLSGTRQEQIVEGNTELINFVTTVDLDSNTRELTREGFFGRGNYDYDNKYFVSGSIRTDGSSRFSKDVRWGTFWSVGGAWRISQENFLKDVSWIDELKIRSSYGEVGNDSNLDNGALSFFAFQTLAGLGFNNAAEAGTVLTSPGNSELTWETNTQTDVAVEFSLFKGRLSGSVEYYNRDTDDLIFDVPLPVSSGFDSAPRNIGSMFNRGVEISISADIFKGENFRWNFTANASTIKNEFTKLPQDEIITGTKKLVVGRSIFDYWLRDWYGVDPADGSALYIPTEAAITANGADIRTVNGTVVTTNQNNGKFDFVGTAIPDLFGSFQNTFQYKGFSFSTLFTYQIGGETYDTNYAAIMSAGTYGTALSTDILKAWKKPGDITNVPRMDVTKTAQFNAASDRWLVGSDFLSLRQVSISYDFPQSILEYLGVDGFKLYANGENLFSITSRKGLEPNQNFNGTTQNRFTPARVLTLGINLAL